jgi:hypothetical protein
MTPKGHERLTDELDKISERDIAASLDKLMKEYIEEPSSLSL